MKPIKSFIPLFFLILVFMIPSISSDKYQRISPKIYTEPFGTLYNINRIAGWIYADGTSGNGPDSEPGISFPRGTAEIVFQDGILWGGYVRDSIDQNPRVGGQTYRTGTQPGHIMQAGDGINPPVASDPNDARAHIYRIRRDYLTMSDDEVRADAADLLLKDPGQVTAAEMVAVRNQYAADWADWPADLGAPFYDNNGNGLYEPNQGEEPGLAGADQVIWFVCNDLDDELTVGLFGSEPLGIELQVTIWAYRDSLLQDIVYRRYRLINQSGFLMEDMYIGLWSDSDIGTFTNDFAGCDSNLSVSYCYNSYPTDPLYAAFDLPPAAAGFALLQGPVIPFEGDSAIVNFKVLRDHINLSMTSHAYNPVALNMHTGSYSSSLGWYNALRGYVPTSDLVNPTPYTTGSGPDRGKPTRFPLSGDPVSGFGDVDGEEDNMSPGDRRTVINTGPFMMAPGDTQEVVIALIGGIDPLGDHLSAVSDMKSKLRTLRANYPVQKKTIAAAHTVISLNGLNTQINIAVNAAQYPGAQTMTVHLAPEIGTEPDTLFELNDAGMDGDAAAGDHLWTGRAVIANRRYPFAGSVTVATAGDGETFAAILPHLCLRPLPVLGDFGVIWENGRQDALPNHGESVYATFSIENNDAGNAIQSFRIFEAGLLPDRVDKPIDLPDTIQAGAAYANPDLYFSLAVPAAGDSFTFSRRITFDHHSVIKSFTLPIQSWQPPVHWGDTLNVITISGFPGNVVPVIADADLLTGHVYRMTFSRISELDPAYVWQLVDRTTGAVKWTNGKVFYNEPVIGAPVVDGVMYNVISPGSGFHAFQVVANASGVLDPPEQGALAFNNSGFPLVYNTDRPDAARQQANGSTWGIHTGMTGVSNGHTYDYFETRVTQGGARWPEISPYDWEIRFTYEPDNRGLEPDAFTGTGNKLINVPFELWNIGSNTPDDPADDWRLFPYLMDSDINEVFNLTPIDHVVSGGDDDPETDWFYWVIPEDRSPGEGGYQSLLTRIQADIPGYIYLDGTDGDAMRRMVLVNWNGGDVNDPTFPNNVNAVMPEAGTVFRIITNKPVSEADTFEINSDLACIGTKDPPLAFELGQNYPNPFNLSTRIRFSLPADTDVRLIVYNILGQKVATLADRRFTRGRHVITWNGRNDRDLPLSSGLYIYRITAGTFQQSRKMVLVK